MNQVALISRLNELPRINSLLHELLDMVNQSDVDFSTLSRKMSMDQVLSARLLRMANSAYFGGNKTISNVNDAVIRVGSEPVKTLVIASVLSSAFPHITTLNIEEYWFDTFEVAVIANKLSSKVGVDPNLAFTTGILHNIGELMIHTLVPELAAQINQRVDAGEDIYSVQEELLDVSSPTLGARLAKSWKFPPEMVDAIENFDQPRDAEISPKLAGVIHLARAINQQWDVFSSEDQKMSFLALHPDAKLLGVPSTFYQNIDKARGSGVELAKQMLNI